MDCSVVEGRYNMLEKTRPGKGKCFVLHPAGDREFAADENMLADTDTRRQTKKGGKITAFFSVHYAVLGGTPQAPQVVLHDLQLALPLHAVLQC